jgi:hypothetical protein
MTAVIEIKDAVQVGVTFGGWGLALYLYVRNEWTKRPLVSVNFRRFKAGDKRLVGVLTVRNRGPWNIRVETLKVVGPTDATIAVPKPHRSGARANGDDPDAPSQLEMLAWPLRAYASGEFPSRSSWFEVNWPAGSKPPFVEVDVVIDVKRPAIFSKRLTTRHRIRRANT